LIEPKHFLHHFLVARFTRKTARASTPVFPAPHCRQISFSLGVVLPWSAPAATAPGKRIGTLGKAPYAFVLADGATAVVGTSGAVFKRAPKIKARVGGQ
jgi:hypothetical protein